MACAGNAKIVQELEGNFRGAGWDVIKLLWGKGWDDLLEKDTSGKLRQLMEETVDGDYQTFKSKDGAYIRKNFFGKYPETAALVEDWTDDQIWACAGRARSQEGLQCVQARHGGKGQPTVVLVKTVRAMAALPARGRTPRTSKRKCSWISSRPCVTASNPSDRC